MSIFNKFGLSIAALIIALLAPLANASLLIEPYLGYTSGKGTSPGVSNSETGVLYGARLGIQHLGFMAGLDYMGGNWTDNATPSNTYKPGDLGVFVGFNFPILIRVYGEYGFMAKRDVSNSSGSDTLKGSEIKLGVGFTGLPFISINLEYIGSVFTKNNAGTLTNNYDEAMYALSVSLPLTFM